MVKTQLSAIAKNPKVLLGLIFLAFFCREAFLVALFPLFTGQDEARHYNTIQWLSEKHNPTCRETAGDNEQDKHNLGTYRFSEEIRRTSDAANLSAWRRENYHKPPYVSGSTGLNESLIQERVWSRTNTTCPPDIAANAKSFSLFHWAGSLIERNWEETDILIRFYLIRLMVVFFGALTILFAYLTTREVGFSQRAGLSIAFILSLQPKLSVYTTNINYDTLLIPCFALFLWAGLRFLRQGLTLGNTSLLLVAIGGAALTKGTGLVLFGGLLFLGGWTILNKRAWWQKLTLRYWLIGGSSVLALSMAILNTYSLFSLFPDFSFSSFFQYLSQSLPKIPSSSLNFWGVINWTEASHGAWFVWGIWLLEATALYGLIRFFRNPVPPSFLPSKPAVLFILIILLSLQLGVRLHDWHIFQTTGSLALGTPGRYFLPTLLPQLLLIAIGLGSFLRRPIFLERCLLLFAVLILAFHLYNTWLIILPRFYL